MGEIADSHVAMYESGKWSSGPVGNPKPKNTEAKKMGFQKATKKQSKLRAALCGPSGAGKTFTALTLATNLSDKVAVIDTERGSASKYADIFDFDVMELDTFHPENFINGLKEAQDAGYEVVVIDSLSHAWIGKDGVLEQHDKAVARQKTANSFTAWRDVTPLHNQLVDAILQSKMHVIVTMRSKTEYVQTEENGRKTVKKVGMAPVQRDGMEYEFDIVGDMDFENNFIVTKSRCRSLTGAVINKPGADMADIIKTWLTDGEAVKDPKERLIEAMALAGELFGITDRDGWNKVVQEQLGKIGPLTSTEVEQLIEMFTKEKAARAEQAAGKETKKRGAKTDDAPAQEAS